MARASAIVINPLIGTALGAWLMLGSGVQAQCEQQRIPNPAPQKSGSFAYAVAIDGPWAAIRVEHPNGYAGGVQVYARTPSGLVPRALLTAADGTPYDVLGLSLALSGSVIVAGAPGANAPGLNSGAAYVFEYGATGWREVQKLQPVVAGADDFGESVDVDGPVAVVGASSSGPGLAVVYRRINEVWVEDAVLTPSDGVNGDEFGFDVAVSGTTVVVGAYDHSDPTSAAGAAYVYELQAGAWVEVQKLLSPDPPGYAQFGVAVEIDGDWIVVGDNATNPKGAAYLFERTVGTWSYRQALEPPSSADDQFGWSLALDGATLLVGSAGDDSSLDLNSVFLYDDVDGFWQLRTGLAIFDPVPFSYFGQALDLDGDQALVAAPSEPDPVFGYGKGAAYLMSLDGAGCPPLIGTPQTFSLSSGGLQAFTLNAGPDAAGKQYLLLGSVSYVPGFSFGIEVGPFTVPLSWDAYLQFTLRRPNTPPLVDSLGVLDENGVANAKVMVGDTWFPASLVGFTLHHAFVVLEPGAPVPFSFVSNAVPLVLLP